MMGSEVLLSASLAALTGLCVICAFKSLANDLLIMHSPVQPVSRTAAWLTTGPFGDALMAGLKVGDALMLILRWERFLTICKTANIRLGPKKVIIAPQTTQILGWIWKHGGILEVDPHATNRLQHCEPPTTAEGLRGWVGAYKFMSSAIPNHAQVLEPLNKAIGDKSKSDPIEWTDELRESFKRAQESLLRAQPLTMPKPGEPLFMTTDASQTGLGATLHRQHDGAVVKHFSKQLSAHKKNWLPCELEALAVGTGLQTFLPFFRESDCKPVIYTDSTPVVMAFNKMQRGAFSASPRVSTFLHNVVNSGATVKYLPGKSNHTADQASRNAATCGTPRCQVCSWVSDKEVEVVRRLEPDETTAVLAGNSPMPFQSRLYWRRRQLEDRDLTIVAHHLKFGTNPPKTCHKVRVKRYLQPKHGLFLSADNVLLAPSTKAFSATPRFVVPEAAIMSVVAIFHQQFGCLAASPLKELLRRHFFMLDLDNAVDAFVTSCMQCAAKRDKRHTVPPMSSVPPPSYFGEQFAADVIKREKQKIFILRETATSYTWSKLIKDERSSTLEAALRSLFAQVRPPNAARPAVCRIDNAQAFVSLTIQDCLKDIGVKLELSNPANKNSNPVAEKANREMHYCLITVLPSGGKLTESVLATATALLNSKPRWSTMSAVELWTGRDMVTGVSLLFNQQDIIAQQQARREATHPKTADPLPVFHQGDIVFNNEEKSKLKTRDKLVVREYLGGGMYRLDRLHDSTGRLTRAFLPARCLYKPGPQPALGATDEPLPVSPKPQAPVLSSLPTQGDSMPTARSPSPMRPTLPRIQRPVPVAPGYGAKHVNPLPEQQLFAFPSRLFQDCDTDFLPAQLDNNAGDGVRPDTPEPAASDDEPFFSADAASSPDRDSSADAASGPDQDSPADAASSPDQDRPPEAENLRRSSRSRKPPVQLVYGDNFKQVVKRKTLHQQRRAPTPVKKSASQESRDKVKKQKRSPSKPRSFNP